MNNFLRLITRMLIFTCAIFAPLDGVIILVHGSYATGEQWCRPKGDFYEALRTEAKKRHEAIVPFAWSGKLSDEARLQGAEALAQLISSYPTYEKITLIGHSHGGNVIALASSILYDPFEDEDFMQELFADLREDRKTEAVGEHKRTEHAHVDEMTLTPEQLLQAQKRFHATRALIKKSPPPLISAAYFLGTPVMQTPYEPNMKVIWRAFHCYSLGDNIQTGLGMLYDRIMPKQDRLVNLRFMFNDGDPSHSQMHDPTIATWLLSMPEELKKNGFEAFTYTVNGRIRFDSDGMPNYERV